MFQYCDQKEYSRLLSCLRRDTVIYASNKHPRFEEATSHASHRGEAA
jgi:hypothetical protein